jgi:rare lipoprotein A
VYWIKLAGVLLAADLLGAVALAPDACAGSGHGSVGHRVGRHTGAMIGLASIYGGSAKYGGRRTASGERGRQGGLTAAHRTLPFGTMVQVTNRSNGRSVVVRINDRGPFIRGRVIDVTAAAARVLGFSGLVRVSLAVVGRR